MTYANIKIAQFRSWDANLTKKLGTFVYFAVYDYRGTGTRAEQWRRRWLALAMRLAIYIPCLHTSRPCTSAYGCLCGRQAGDALRKLHLRLRQVAQVRLQQRQKEGRGEEGDMVKKVLV